MKNFNDYLSEFKTNLEKFLAGDVLHAPLKLKQLSNLTFLDRQKNDPLRDESKQIVCGPDEEFQELVYLLLHAFGNNEISMELFRHLLAKIHLLGELMESGEQAHAVTILSAALDYFYGISKFLVKGKNYTFDEFLLVSDNKLLEKPISKETLSIKDKTQEYINSIKEGVIPPDLPSDLYHDYANLIFMHHLRQSLKDARIELEKIGKSTAHLASLTHIVQINYKFGKTSYNNFLLENHVFPIDLEDKIKHNINNPKQIDPLTDNEIIKIIRHHLEVPTSAVECIVLDRLVKQLFAIHESVAQTGQINEPLPTKSYNQMFSRELKKTRRLLQLKEYLTNYKEYLIKRYELNENQPDDLSLGYQKLNVVNKLLKTANDDKEASVVLSIIKNQLDPKVKSPDLALLSRHQDTLGNKLLYKILSCFSKSWAEKSRQHGLFFKSEGGSVVNKINKLIAQEPDSKIEP